MTLSIFAFGEDDDEISVKTEEEDSSNDLSFKIYDFFYFDL